MSEEQKEINVYESRRFEKTMKKLPYSQQKVIDDQIDRIIENPEIGQKKNGDLSHMRVHKFLLDNQMALLGYSWVEDKLEIYILQFGSHENFYDDAKVQRKTDLKLIK